MDVHIRNQFKMQHSLNTDADMNLFMVKVELTVSL